MLRAVIFSYSSGVNAPFRKGWGVLRTAKLSSSGLSRTMITFAEHDQGTPLIIALYWLICKCCCLIQERRGAEGSLLLRLL